MRTIGQFTKAKLVFPVLISRLEFTDELKKMIRDKWGEIDFTSETVPFNFTHYYDTEMTPPIFRFFMTTKELINPQILSEVKRGTIEIEKHFADSGNRKINIDPGILYLSRFILATTKDGSHRIPLQNGIFGEITLMFEKKEFRAQPWTYIDYQSEFYQKVLKHIRDNYKQQLLDENEPYV